MGIELNKSYNPKDFEDKWYSYWQEKGYFSPRKGKKNETFSGTGKTCRAWKTNIWWKNQFRSS